MIPSGRSVVIVAWWTILDECRSRAAGLFLVLGVVLLVFLRGCTPGQVVVNGAPLDATALIAQLAFHAVVLSALLAVTVRGMRLFARDRVDGTQAYVLSRPIARWQYVAGKITGLWAVATGCMVVAHGVLWFLAVLEGRAVSPGYLAASLLCSLNLLWAVVAVVCFSLWLPDFLAVLGVVAVVVVSFVGHGIAAAAPVVQALHGAGPDITWWHVVWVLWPKLGRVQFAAASLVGGVSPVDGASLVAVVNVGVHCGLLAALCVLGFTRDELV